MFAVSSCALSFINQDPTKCVFIMWDYDALSEN